MSGSIGTFKYLVLLFAAMCIASLIGLFGPWVIVPVIILLYVGIPYYFVGRKSPSAS